MGELVELFEVGRVIDEFVCVMVGGIVDCFDEILIVIVESGSIIVVELIVVREDVGKVIGW